MVYGITSSGAAEDKVTQVRGLVAAGVKIIQYRKKTGTESSLLAEAKKIAGLCREAGVVFLVNDDCQLALDSGADGVHLGQEDASPTVARAQLGEAAIIGISTHNPTEARAALTEPIDYIGVGPIFETETKQFAQLAGLEYLEFCLAEIELPFVCIGGITEENLPQLTTRGAKAVALIGELAKATDLKGKVARLTEILEA